MQPQIAAAVQQPVRVSRGRMPTKPTSGKSLVAHAATFERFSTALKAMAMLSPDRLTLSQALFAVLAIGRAAEGRPATLAELKELGGGALNANIRGSYKVFLEPSRAYPDSLGWLRKVPNPNDERESMLELTDKGHAVARALADELE